MRRRGRGREGAVGPPPRGPRLLRCACELCVCEALHDAAALETLITVCVCVRLHWLHVPSTSLVCDSLFYCLLFLLPVCTMPLVACVIEVLYA